MQERLAEAGRIALKYNVGTAETLYNDLGKIRHMAQKPMIMQEYNRAELLI